MKLGKKLRYVAREAPKIAILLVIVATIMFPMYMMFAISLMTPAQLEKFPWFPVKLPIPESVVASRTGVLALAPAAVQLSLEGAPPLQIPVSTDSRFYMQFAEESIGQDHWTEKPRTDSRSGRAIPTVIAEYRAANVWEVRQAGPAQYTVEGRAWAVPAGFVSVLPGLQLKNAAGAQLRTIEAASRWASEALKVAGSVERIKDPAEQAGRRLEAVRTFLRTEQLLPLAEKALSRAEELAAEARAMNVVFDEGLATARESLVRARVNRDRAAARIAGYRAALELAAREEVGTAPAVVENDTVFKVERNEPVAVLSIDRPARLTRTSGAIRIDTEWRFPLEVRRPFRVRSLIAKTVPEGREPIPGEPLAELVAARDVELVWREQGWWVDDRPFEALLPPGFLLLDNPGPRGAAGAVRTIQAGQIVARAGAPRVSAVSTGTGTLVVGLAIQQGNEWRILPGDGRWAYSLRSDRETPFAVRLNKEVTRSAARMAAGEAEEQYDLSVRSGGPLAQLYVNRGRTVVSDSVGRWVSRQDSAPLIVPPGFLSRFPAPAPGKSETRALPADTILAELAMPKATLIVNDDFIILRLTGGDWGSGQWEYPLGELETLQTVPAALPPLAEGGSSGVPGGAVVAEIRATRQTVLRYVNQSWQLADGTVIPMADEDAQRHALNNFEAASRRLQAARQDAGQTVPGAQVSLAEAQGVYEDAWRQALRVDQAAAFAGLTGPGQILDSAKNLAVVQAGDVLARLYAEKPGPQAIPAVPAKPMLTHVRRDGRTFVVTFSHEAPLPVRAIAALQDRDRVSAGQTICTLLTPQRFAYQNYVEAAAYVVPFILNTVFVALTSMVLGLFFASLSAFVFARFRFPGKSVLYAMIMVLLMIPGVLNLIPLYIIVKQMNLLNSLWAIILPAIAGAQVINVYIMRNNLEMLAKDLFDAARIDGASNFQTYWHIAMPLSKPILGTLAIFALLSEWNNYIWPWIVLKDQEKMTITAGLALLESQNLSDYGLQMAGSVIASLPLVILFFFMMNLFIRGIQSGAIKA